MSKTCSACRSKKIRCDGAVPVCRACTKTRQPVECSYTATATPRGPKADILQKGAACNACRQKKRKCDAKRPCSPCIAADKQDDCQYRDDRAPVQTTSSRQTHSHTPILAKPVETSTNCGEITQAKTPEPETPELHIPSSFSSRSSSVAPSSSVNNFDFSGILGFDFDSVMNDESSNPSHFSSPSLRGSDNSSDCAISTTIPRNDLMMPYFPQSNDDTMLIFRTIFLAHRIQLGLCISQPKLDAILCGDLSGDIVDPILVHIAQLWGCHFCDFSESEEATHLQAALKVLDDTDTQLRSDPGTGIQIRYLLALYFLIKGDMYRGREYLLKASNVVMMYNLHIAEPTMVTSSGLEFGNEYLSLRTKPETQDELVMVLCHLVYLDKCTNLVFSFPTLFTSDMDQELQMLPKVNSSICSSSVVTQRARSIAFLQQAKNLSMQWNSDCDVNSSPWSTKYWQLMRMIHLHQADVKSAMLKASFTSDREHIIALKLCHIKTLTALAYLHDILAPNHPDSRRSCFNIVVEIVHTTDFGAEEDYSLMDPVIGLCWTFAADILKRECQLNNINLPTEHCVPSMLAVLQHNAQRLKQVSPYVSDIL